MSANLTLGVVRRTFWGDHVSARRFVAQKNGTLFFAGVDDSTNLCPNYARA